MEVRFIDICLLLFGWLSITSAVLALFSQNWINDGLASFEGLVTGEEDGQGYYVGRSAWLNVVTGLMVLGILMQFCAHLVPHYYWLKGKPRMRFFNGSLVMNLGSTILILVATSIFSSNVIHGYSGSGQPWSDYKSVNFGTGFIISWITCGLMFLTLLFNAEMVNHIKTEKLRRKLSSNFV